MYYLIWLPYTVASVIYAYSFLRHRHGYETQYKQKEAHSPKIIFQVTTKGNNIGLVEKNINVIHEINKDINYTNYEVHVVTDGDEKYNCPNDEIKTINVPSDFICKLAKYKARALQYATNVRKKEYGDKLPKIWIMHLDEESYVTKNVILASIFAIEESIAKKDGKLVFEGAINYPNDFFKTQLLIPSLVEAERSFGCHFCCAQMEDTPLWLHGSNMLVRADIEDDIGWDFDSLAEDSCFGYQIANKYGKVFGWHHGTMLEQPAYNIGDMIKQRKRRYYGTLQNLKYLGWKKKLMQLSFLISWKAGFLANMIGIPSLLGMIKSPEFLQPIFMFNLLFWIFSYQYGTYLNIRHIDIGITKKISVHTYCLLMTPLIGFVSTLPAIMALINRPKTFDIVKKS